MNLNSSNDSKKNEEYDELEKGIKTDVFEGDFSYVLQNAEHLKEIFPYS